MALAILLLPCLIALVIAAYVLLRDPLHPFFILLLIFAVLVPLNLALADAVNFYPLRASGIGALILGLSALAAGMVTAALIFPRREPADFTARFDPGGTYLLALVLFGLFMMSTAFYWRDVNAKVGIATALLRPARLKAAELGGSIDANSAWYLFRSTLIVPVALALAVYRNPQLRIPKLLLGSYLLLSLVQVRRDPIVFALSGALAVGVILERDRRRLLIPLAAGVAGMLVMTIGLVFALKSFNIPATMTLFGYTAGQLSSFQAVLDDYYPATVGQPAERTLYFFYSAMKFLDPTLRPGPLIKPNPSQPLLPNTYTFLTDYYLDFGIAGLVIGPFLIGMFMYFAYNLALRRPTFTTLSLFSAVYGVTVMSFMNNEWGWLTIPGTVLFAAVASLLLLGPLTAVARTFRGTAPEAGTRVAVSSEQ